MKFNQLGAFEELVLLAIGVLDDNAYGVSVREEISARTGRATSIGALHSALSRLTDKGFVESHEGGATAERGGRRKRYYRITGSGKAALIRSHELRQQMIDDIPGLSLS
jgi:DNA-binding PadR family transcriptional regulator